MTKETIRKLAEEYYSENMNGEPLTSNGVLEHMIYFADAIERINDIFKL